MITKEQIENWFTYHDDPNKVPKYKAIREAAKYLANVIMDNTPEGHDQSAAIFQLRGAVMIANAAIACEPPMYGQENYVGKLASIAEAESYEIQVNRLENELRMARMRREGAAMTNAKRP